MKLEHGTFRSPNAEREQLRQIDYQVQQSFADVLQEFGRSGFVSATPDSATVSASTELPNDSIERIENAWATWFDANHSVRYNDYLAPNNLEAITTASTSSDPTDTGSVYGSLWSSSDKPTADQMKAAYGEILRTAYTQGGYVQPRGFLESLPEDQLKTIQKVHRLADAIDPAQLSDEASLNLLLPPPTAVDADRDGLTAIGKAYTIRFPDSHTPANVREAWEKTTADMPEEDVMLYTLQMAMPLLLANMQVDENGQYVGSNDPGSEKWINPMASPDYSYTSHVADWIQYLDDFKNLIPAEQYARDKAFWSRFQNELELAGV